MTDEKQQDNRNANAGAPVPDEQLEEASGGYSNITLKPGYVSNDELWDWPTAELAQDDPQRLVQGE